MKHIVGGAGQRAKVVFNESSGKLKIWERGWIGKRKYRVNLNQISSVTCGYYTSKIRLPLHGFAIEFNHNGKNNVVVAIPGQNKRFVSTAERVARAIGRAANLKEYSVAGSSAFFSRISPDTEAIEKIQPTAPDGTPLTKTEQVISGVARGTKNVVGEIASDARNTSSRIGKTLLTIIGVLIFLALFGSNPIAAIFVLFVGVMIYRKFK